MALKPETIRRHIDGGHISYGPGDMIVLLNMVETSSDHILASWRDFVSEAIQKEGGHVPEVQGMLTEWTKGTLGGLFLPDFC